MDIAESARSQMKPMLIQIWKAFEFNNLRFSPEMFCHISVIKDDCCVVAYGCFFLPKHLQVSGGANRKSSTLFTADAATILVWMRSFAGIFLILFLP